MKFIWTRGWNACSYTEDAPPDCRLEVEEDSSAVFLSYANCLDFVELEAQ